MPKQPFSPIKLPPRIDYEKLVGEITKANIAISRLDVLLSQLQNPRLLARTFATREAVLSSQIEGTQATLSEVLEHEAQAGVNPESTPKEQDFREILNYRRALERGVAILKDKPLTENVIKELHAILLQSVRGHNKAPGDFRRELVYIGKLGMGKENASYVPPLPKEIPELFSNFTNYINGSEERDLLIQIGVAHYQFEAIHPFKDGNGRIGRLLISLMLYEKKLLSHPFIYLSEFFEEHRQEYYDLLRDVSERGDWNSWLSFFLRGLEVQAKKAQEATRGILELHRSLAERVSGEMHSQYANMFLDAMFVHPFFTSSMIHATTKIKNKQTLFSLIEKFKNAGIIIDMRPNQRRNKVYRFNSLHRILNR